MYTVPLVCLPLQLQGQVHPTPPQLHPGKEEAKQVEEEQPQPPWGPPSCPILEELSCQNCKTEIVDVMLHRMHGVVAIKHSAGL